MNNFDRRNLDRYRIPQAKVVYKTADGTKKSASLIDISKSSMRFELLSDLKAGYPLEFELDIPARQNITLKGQIIGIMKNNSESSDSVVLQLAPFGSDERYNSPESYKQLGELIKKQQEVGEDF